MSIPLGVWPVMLTPFATTGEIDWPGVDALTDWYIAAGVAGLFSVCLSSEMYHLTEEERLALAGRVVRRAAGRVPVVASGTFGGPIAEQARFVQRIAQTGVQAVVVLTCQLAGPEQGDDVWRSQAEHLLSLTGEIPLGLYECPTPYKRLLSPALIGWAAASGRFVFHKDTCCALGPIHDKLAAVRGTPFRWLNAHTPTLLASLQLGGAGFCGIGANFCPELTVWLCAHFLERPQEAVALQRFLSCADMVVRHKYPTSAKTYLAQGGLPITAYCRNSSATLDEEELLILRHLREAVEDWRERL